MLRKIVHLFFIVLGGTVGYLYIPDLLKLMKFLGPSWVLSPYLGLLLGAIILFFISYLFVDYIVDFLRWIEDGLIKKIGRASCRERVYIKVGRGELKINK